MKSQRSERLAWAFIGLLAVLCVLPFVWVLPLWPTSRDAMMWILEGDLQGSRWIEWTFFTQQFQVGYRPVTGLSYSVNEALVGHWAPGFRAVDLLLYVAVILLTPALLSRWTKATPLGLVASGALVALHPVSEQVVPHLARRGYSLCLVFSLAGLWFLSPKDRKLAPLGVALLSLGALSNEAGYVALVVAVLATLPSLPDMKDRKGLVLPASIFTTIIALLGARLLLVGAGGGYHAERFSHFQDIISANTLAIAGQWPMRAQQDEPSTLAFVLCALAALALTAVAARHYKNRVSSLYFLWLAGLFVVYLPHGVWFPRQVFMPVVALSLFIASVSHTKEGKALLALSLLSFSANSPLIWGSDPVKQFAFTNHDRALRSLDDAVAQLPAKTKVHLILPHYKRAAVPAFKAREKKERKGSKIATLWLRSRHHVRVKSSLALFVPFKDTPKWTVSRDTSSKVSVTAPSDQQWSASGEVASTITNETLQLSYTIKPTAVVLSCKGANTTVLP